MRKTRIITLMLVLLTSLALVGVALAQEGAPETEAASNGALEPMPAGVMAVSHIYTNTTPVAVPDSNCTTGYVTSTIAITDSFLIGDLNVGIWQNHTYRGDLEYRLVHPDGTVLDLLLDPDGAGDNLNALIDDGSPNLASGDTTNHIAPPPYYTAWYRPTSPLSAFNGKNAQGVWTMRVCDDAGGDTGSLNTWTLFFESGLVISPATANGAACMGNDVDYTFSIANATAVTQSFSIVYTSTWPYSGPTATGVLAPGNSENILVTVHVPNSAIPGVTDSLTVSASGSGDNDQATATTRARLNTGWTQMTSSLLGVRHPAIVYLNGAIYQMGGQPTSNSSPATTSVYSYSVAADSWFTLASMPGARYYVDGVAIGDNIYVPGGLDGSTYYNTLQIYTPTLNTWGYGAPMPAAVGRYAAVVLNDKLYVMGGGTGSTSYNTVYIYDPVLNSWSTGVPMLTGRTHAVAATIGGKIYVAGGGTVGTGTVTNSVEVFDPVAGSWSYVASAPQVWAAAADGVLYDRYMIVVGGGTTPTTASNAAAAYDTVTNQWFTLVLPGDLRYGAEADGDGSMLYVIAGREFLVSFFMTTRNEMLTPCPAADADLTCLKLDSADPVNYGETITYTLFVTNTGNADTWSTLVTDTLPAGVTYVSSSPECVEAGGVVTCTTGSLRNGLSDQFQIVVTAPAATVLLTNTVEVASYEADLNLANNTDDETTQVTNAQIVLAKTVGTDPNTCASTDAVDVLSGAEATYCYTVLNTGSVTLTTHTLVDSVLGTILSGFPYTLTPGASAFITQTAIITQTTVNNATWSATDGFIVADDSDSATVNVVPATISLAKTVGTDPNTCAPTGSIAVNSGTQVTYCFEVTNTSPSALITHTLADSELGLLLFEFPYSLAPGASAFITESVVITATTVNTATWTATDGVHTAAASDTALVTAVTVIPGCGLPLENFNAGTAGFPPAGWTVVDNLTTGTHAPWRSNEQTGEPNHTGGDGFAADANVDALGSGSQMNTDLYSPFFSLSDASTALLSYRYDYNDLGVADYGAVDISLDGGVTWTNLATYLVDDRGPKQANLDLAAFAGAPAVQLRYHYTAPGWDWWFQVDDIVVYCNPAPDIALSANAFSAAQQPDTQTTQVLNIANIGTLALDWAVLEVPAESSAPFTPASPTLRLSDGSALPVSDEVSATEVYVSTPADASAPRWERPEAVLYDNGPLVTHPGGGAGGADASRLQNSSLLMTTLGFGNQLLAGNSMADDFVVTGSGWYINQFTFFAYQTNSGTTSTITGVYYRIWDGDPTLPGSTIIYGDLTTNRLTNTAWSNIYRESETSLGSTARPIMANIAAAGVFLQPGDYWVEWITDGSLASGPWAPPITINGQTTTGNAYQNQNGLWVVANDGGSLTPQGMPFIVEGSVGCPSSDVPWLSVTPISGTLAAGANQDVQVTFDSTGLSDGDYHAFFCVESNDPDSAAIFVPITLTVELGAMPTWDKEIFINGVPYTPGDSPYTVVDGDSVIIVDAVSALSYSPITYTLTEEWEGALSFVGAEADFGLVTPGANMLTWDVSGGISGTLYTLTKTFTVDDSLAWNALITETLEVVNGPAAQVIPLAFNIPASLTKDAPATAQQGDVIPYTIVIDSPSGVAGSVVLTDVLPGGVEFAGGLTATFGSASFDPGDNAVYWSNSGRSVELSLGGEAPVALVVDDGVAENNIGIGGTWEFIYLNRFTPAAGEFPFTLDQIQVYFNGGTTFVNVGDDILLAVYENTSGNADPAVGSNLLATFPATVLSLNAWNVYNLATPVALNGPGDVLIGVIALEVPGTSYFPAAIDMTASQVRSWAGWWLTTPPPNPPALPPTDSWGTIDSFGFPGNWMIRGYGDTVELPSTITITFDVTVTAASGTIINTADMDFNGTDISASAETALTADVTFVYHDLEDVVQVGEPVYVAGSFPDWWNPSGLLLTPNPEYSVFTGTMTLLPGSYEYKYVVNGTWANGGGDLLNTSNRAFNLNGNLTLDDYRNVDVGWAHLGDPIAVTITLGEDSGDLIGEVYIQGVTNPAGVGRGVHAQLGYGSDPDPSTWTWVDMVYTGDAGNNDLFSAVVTPLLAGEYTYGVRFDGNWGVGNPNAGWTNGDRTGILTVIESIRKIFLPIILRAFP